MGAVRMDDIGADYGFHGFSSGIQGAGAEKEIGLFYGKPDFVHFIRAFSADS